ncbi:MAG: efflux RND transporter periplasmic adaptor subunit, partial [Myxococcota bacterium]|nr:efflux RND transporter periplasmic adaptor subunit [Myxococcota bacterium]
MSAGRSIVRVLAPVVVLGIGVTAMVALIQSRPQATKKPAAKILPLVEISAVAEVAAQQTSIHGMGTVKPARVLTLQPEVMGRVVSHHEQLVVGGRINEGDELLRIDDREYSLIAEQQRSQVARAKLELQIEQGRKAIAEREWGAMKSSLAAGDDAGRSLALREPHLRAARSAVQSARSALDRSLLQVERTVLTAPFNAYVREEAVEVGQYVGLQSRVATLVGTDAVWVEVSLPVDKLSWISIPDGERQGSLAWVEHDVGKAAPVRWQGRVLRLLEELEPQGRMARVLVEVRDPFGGERPDQLPLLVGAYVSVTIEGRSISRVIQIPRVALHDDDHVWLVDENDQLVRQVVTIAWRDRDRLFISEGLKSGDRLVTSPVVSPVVGAPV